MLWRSPKNIRCHIIKKMSSDWLRVHYWNWKNRVRVHFGGPITNWVKFSSEQQTWYNVVISFYLVFIDSERRLGITVTLNLIQFISVDFSSPTVLNITWSMGITIICIYLQVGGNGWEWHIRLDMGQAGRIWEHSQCEYKLRSSLLNI